MGVDLSVVSREPACLRNFQGPVWTPYRLKGHVNFYIMTLEGSKCSKDANKQKSNLKYVEEKIYDASLRGKAKNLSEGLIDDGDGSLFLIIN